MKKLFVGLLALLWCGNMAYAQPATFVDNAPYTFVEEPPPNAYFQGVPTIRSSERSAPAVVTPGIPSTSCLQGHYKPSWGIVQVASQRRTGGVDLGTAVSVGKHADGRRLFLTAAHCVGNSNCVELYGQGLNSRAQVLATDSNHDVALLAAAVPDGHPMRDWELAQESIPTEGDVDPATPDSGPMPMGGYSPESSQYRQVEPTLTDLGPSRMWGKAHLRDGMSGGPIYDRSSKKLTGIIVARGARQPWVLGVNSEFLRGFLAANLDKRSLAGVRSSRPLKLPSNWVAMNRKGVLSGEWSPVAYHLKSSRMPGPPRWLWRR